MPIQLRWPHHSSQEQALKTYNNNNNENQAKPNKSRFLFLSLRSSPILYTLSYCRLQITNDGRKKKKVCPLISGGKVCI